MKFFVLPGGIFPSSVVLQFRAFALAYFPGHIRKLSNPYQCFLSMPLQITVRKIEKPNSRKNDKKLPKEIPFTKKIFTFATIPLAIKIKCFTLSKATPRKGNQFY
jgi:hypothetical protein